MILEQTGTSTAPGLKTYQAILSRSMSSSGQWVIATPQWILIGGDSRELMPKILPRF
jgi:hypothetical protein